MEATTIDPLSAFAGLIRGMAEVEVMAIATGKNVKSIEPNAFAKELIACGQALGLIEDDMRLTILGCVAAGEFNGGRKVVLPGVYS
jgi:hypothetical protein